MNALKSVAEKVATKPAQTNGTETKTPTAKEAFTAPAILPEKKEDAENNLPPIEARIKRLDELQELAERRQTVAEAIHNLDEFYIAPDGRGCNLKLQDSKGRTYAIAHPSVIGEMVSLAKGKLSAELARIENSIVFNI